MSNSDITSKYESERLRAAEQSQIVYLQGQIDELRRQLKDQTNKYNWAMEQVRKVEASVSQIDGILSRHRQEIAQSLEGYRRDIVTLRKEVAGALVNIEEGQKPIREMQTQIHQLAETRKQDRDATASWLTRIIDLEEKTRGWFSQIREVDERYRNLAGRFEHFATADEALKIEMRKINEDLQVEKQSFRRQAAEAQQLIVEVRNLVDEQRNRISRLEDIRQHIEHFAEQLPAQIVEVDTRLNEQVGEVKRIERIFSERFLITQERVEELRHQHDEHVIALQDTDEQHLRQFTAWLERIDTMVREIEQRVSRVSSHIDVVERETTGQLAILERRDTQLIEALTVTLHEQGERIRAEQVEQGSDEENKDR